MTDKDRLDKCIEFLDFLEKMSNGDSYRIFGMSNEYNSEYGMNEISIRSDYDDSRTKLNEILEKAWHLRMDIA